MSDIKKVVAEYIAKGLQVVPLAPGTKACKDTDWKELKFKPEDFDEHDNIGIRSIDGIVVVDVDSTEAVAMADHFLPGTGTIYGRTTKPKSKRIYKSKIGEKIIAYKDGAEMIIEIRVNHQDMAPPSIHPDGEKVEWYQFGEPTDVDPEVLKKSVRLLASAALIAANYNPAKERHFWCMALVGELKKIGLAEDETINVIKHAAACAGDGDITDRLGVIGPTYARGDNEAISAGKDLAELTTNSGEQFVKSLRKIWGQSTTQLGKDFLDEMNKKHAVVFTQAGGMTVITEESNLLRFSTFETIKQLYPQKVQVGTTLKGSPIVKNLGTAWLETPARREFKGIELNAKETTNGYYNLWKGFSRDPKKGEWPLYRQHLLDIIASGDKEYATWIFQWMASAVQNPTIHANTALVLQGGQGVGKSTFVEWFGALFGSHFLELSDLQQLIGRFNAHLHNALLVLADEAIWGGRSNTSGVGSLRRMVTQDTIAIERKGHDILTVPNHIHLIIASNADKIIPAHRQERRFAVFTVSESMQKNTKFFAAVHKELFEQDGLAALLYDLLECKITVDLREIPQTDALQQQKMLSQDPLNEWWYDLLSEGNFIWEKKHHDSPDFQIEKEQVYEHYLEWAKNSRSRTKVASRVAFWKSMKQIQNHKLWRDRKTGRRYILFPGLEECRVQHETNTGARVSWPEYEDGSEGQDDMPF